MLPWGGLSASGGLWRGSFVWTCCPLGAGVGTWGWEPTTWHQPASGPLCPRSLAGCALCPRAAPPLALAGTGQPGEALAVLVKGSRACRLCPWATVQSSPLFQEASGEGGAALVSWASRDGPCHPGVLPATTAPTSLEKGVSRPLTWGFTWDLESRGLLFPSLSLAQTLVRWQSLLSLV